MPEGRLKTSPERLLLRPDEPSFAFLECTLQENAPPHTTGYRIGMAGPHSQPVRWFPALGWDVRPGSYWHRWGSHAARKRGKYAVLYVDDKVRVLD